MAKIMCSKCGTFMYCLLNKILCRDCTVGFDDKCPHYFDRVENTGECQECKEKEPEIGGG